MNPICTLLIENSSSSKAQAFISKGRSGGGRPREWMQLFCLQLEALAYNCVWQLSRLRRGLFYLHVVCLTIGAFLLAIEVFSYSGNKHLPPPPRGKYYENNSPTSLLSTSGGRLRQNYVIAKKPTVQELFCVIGSCRDLKLFHVELHEIYVTPERK